MDEEGKIEKHQLMTIIKLPLHRFDNLKGASVVAKTSSGAIFVKGTDIIYMKNGAKEPSSTISIKEGHVSACHVDNNILLIGTDAGLIHQIVLQKDETLMMFHENVYDVEKPVKKIEGHISDDRQNLFIHHGDQALFLVDGGACTKLSKQIVTLPDEDSGFILHGHFIYKIDETVFCSDLRELEFVKIAEHVKILMKVDLNHFITQNNDGQITFWDVDLSAKAIIKSDQMLRFATFRDEFLTIVLGDHQFVLFNMEEDAPKQIAEYTYRTHGKIAGISMNSLFMLIIMTDTQKIISVSPFDRCCPSRFKKVHKTSDESSSWLLENISGARDYAFSAFLALGGSYFYK